MSAPAENYGEIFDRGYLHYSGPRLGQLHAIWALARYSMARAIGMRRPWTAKVVPALLYVAVALPVVISIGIRAFFPAFDFLDYASFFGAIFILEGMFVAMTTPEMVSSDRHDRVLPLYFSRPIGRNAYVIAKLLGTGILTLSISLIPAAVLWFGNGLLAQDPLVAMREGLDDLGKIVIAGVLIAFYLGAIGLTISSFTGRKSIAVGVIILGFVLMESLAFAISEALSENPDMGRWAFLISPANTIASLVDGLFGIPEMDNTLPLPVAIGVMVGVTVVCCLIMFVAYQRRD